MKKNNYLFVYLLILFSCHSQTERKTNQLVGGPCEGCEAIHEYGSKILSPVDTLPKYEDSEPKLKISGTVFQQDGKTPAEDIILYIYQTNRKGIYEKKGDEKGWAKRHGYIRGWVKTGKNGEYTFYTFRPGAYPERNEPEHIHLTVKEPARNEYYLDDYVFEDDPFLTRSERDKLRNRGGSGLVIPSLENNILTVNRDIILGQNIPNYK